MKELTFLILISLSILSCSKKTIDKDLKIYGYKLGDKINNDFIEIDKYGENFELFRFKQDKRFRARTIKNHIFEIYGSKLTEREFEELQFTLNEQLVKKTNEFCWSDSITGTSYSMVEKFYSISISDSDYSLSKISNNDSIYFMSITNDKLTDSIGKKLIKDYEKEEIIEMEIIE